MRLATPAGSGTRPTSDRVREALFSRLEHLEVLVGARVVDLYAGSGALGLEAASRGAASVLLVESDKGAAKVTRQNADALGIPGITVRHTTVQRALARRPAEPQTLVFLDPPYELTEEALAADLAALVDAAAGSTPRRWSWSSGPRARPSRPGRRRWSGRGSGATARRRSGSPGPASRTSSPRPRR